MSTSIQCQQWAAEEFASAQLGNSLRTQRAIQMASAIAAHPAGKITEVFLTSAERLGAFRFVESEQICTAALASAAHHAAALRCRPFRYVYVAVDQSELRITDTQNSKGLGDVGTFKDRAKGLQVLNALALSPQAVPLGLVEQLFWARLVGKKQSVQARRDKPEQQKETGLWMQAIQHSAQLLEQQAPTCWPWYQLDRGADAWPVLWMSLGLRGLVTVRAAWDRRLWRHPEQEQQNLFGHVGAQEPVGSYLLHIAAGPNRIERDCVLQVRVAQVELELRDHFRHVKHRMPLFAVLAREELEPPPGQKRIQWLLLTTYPVFGAQAAQQVLFAYSQRWKVEEFHKLWKSGACDVEATQLQSRKSIQRWAVLLSSVAVRIQRLTMLARQQPELPATVELEQGMIDAAMVATEQRKWKLGQVPPIGEVVQWIAQIGGYTGKSSGGPPGALVLTRGLKRLELLAAYAADLHRRHSEGDKC